MHRKQNEHRRTLPAAKSAVPLLLALTLVAAALVVPWTAHADGPAGNLVSNWSLESYQSPYDDYNGYDLRVASSWTRFLASGDWPRFMTDAEYADCFSGVTRHTEGNYSQNLWLAHLFGAGIYQRVAVTAGKPYGAKAMIFSAVGSNSPSGARLIKRVGIDPTGGTDPNSNSVIWGDPDDANKDFNDVHGAARATGNRMTVFISVTNVIDVYPDWNAAWIDAVMLEEAPECAATSPSTSPPGTFKVSWGATDPPNGDIVYYDVDSKDGLNGTWSHWKSKKDSTSDDFPGVAGHTYYFRARAWASYGGVKLYGPFTTSVEGDTSTTVGNVVSGKVDRLDGWHYPGATVSVTGAGTASTTSDADGNYSLSIPGTGSYNLSVGLPGSTYFASPPPVGLMVATGSSARIVPLTLRVAAADSVTNGDFESALGTGWTSSNSGGGAPAIETDYLRSGAQTLALRRGAASAGQSEIRQTLSLSLMWDPLLSFYAALPTATAGDTLKVGIVDGSTCTPLTTITGTSGWTHHWLRLTSGKRDYFTGSLGICFQANQATATPLEVYLDEVSVARGFSGPIDTFLPLLAKGSE